MPRTGQRDGRWYYDTRGGLPASMQCWVWLWAGVLALGGARLTFAQATYTMFPTVPSTSSVLVVQPGNHALSQVTLTLQDSSIAYTMRMLAHQAHLRLAFEVGDPRYEKRITLRVTDTNVMDAFAVALRGTGAVAKLASDGETVVVSVRSDLASEVRRRAEGGTVAGRVTDSASGQGLGGASVRVDGTKLSTVTSDSGNFTLKDVPFGDQVLSAKLFGYRPAERTVTVVDSQRTTVRIGMVPVPTVLSGVVTTATGLQRKVEVGNDITTLNVDSIMQVAPITSVTDLLETRVPGLTVLHSDGVPGDPSRIRIRGASSITGSNDPIVIVDGVRVYASQSDPRNNNLAPSLTGGSGNNTANGQPGGYAAPSPLDQIDPNSIATIEVFKGPSASALYGSDAANGVIVITTKHGRSGPTNWNLALGEGVNWLPGSWPVNYYKFGKDQGNYNQASGITSVPCDWNDTRCIVDSVVPFQALNDPQYSVFAHGSDQTASLTVSGGVPALTYSLTGSAAGDLGNLKLPTIEQQRYDSSYGPIPSFLVRPDNYTTWGVNGSLTAQPVPTVRVALQSSLFNSTQQRSSLEDAITQLEGEYIDPALLETSSLIDNDVEKATAGDLTSANELSLHWQPKPWLPLDATAGIQTMQENDNTYIPYGIAASGFVCGPTWPGCTNSDDTTGYYGLGHGSSHNQTLTVGTSIPMKLVTLALGGNLYSQSTADFSVYTNQLAPGVSVPTSFLLSDGTNSPTSQTTTGVTTYGWYVEPRLNFASRFFVAPGFRLDGGSGGTTSSGSVGSLSAFPKIDLSYVAVDQSHPRGILTLLRPRLAFGLAGTQPDPAQRLRLFNSNDTTTVVTLNGTTPMPIVDLSTLGNTQLRPETSRELEGGFDAELWRGRFSMTYTQYNKTRYNAIIQIPVAPSVLGTQSIQENLGVVRNTGTEMTINTQIFESHAMSWTVGANLSNDNNLVVRLNPGFVPNKTLGIVAGYPLFGDWARPIVAFADLNHDGIIEPNELALGDSLVYVGQADPKYQLNLNTGLTLFNGRLSLNATFAYENGMTQNNQAIVNSGAVNFIANTPGTSLATQAAIVAADCFEAGCGASTPIGFIQTVNTFRFNDLSINLEVPRRMANWFRASRMTLALQGSNLGLHSNYRGIDPDVNAFSTVSGGDETADLGQIPEPRTWWLRLSVGN